MNNIKYSLIIHPRWLELDKEIGNSFFTLFSLLPPAKKESHKELSWNPFYQSIKNHVGQRHRIRGNFTCII